jgi:hypothetical protein
MKADASEGAFGKERNWIKTIPGQGFSRCSGSSARVSGV